jgi:hypothetical protein
MKGNFHVRFLGRRGWATARANPIPDIGDSSKSHFAAKPRHDCGGGAVDDRQRLAFVEVALTKTSWFLLGLACILPKRSLPPAISSTLFHRRRSSAGESAHNCEHSCKDLMVSRKEEILRKFRITTHLRLECSLRSDPNELPATVFIGGSPFRG